MWAAAFLGTQARRGCRFRFAVGIVRRLASEGQHGVDRRHFL